MMLFAVDGRLFLSTPSARRATAESIFLCGGPGYISIHALREEGDAHQRQRQRPKQNFYPRPPRGGRQYLVLLTADTVRISIHALREEGDQLFHAVVRFQGDFYPRPPRGGRLGVAVGLLDVGIISIHALREEGDRPGPTPPAARNDFYPRPPRGGRQLSVMDRINMILFLSTPSARRATGRS